MMRAYELMVIIDGDVDDPKAQAWVKTVTDGISPPVVPSTAGPTGGASASSPTRSTARRPGTTSSSRRSPPGGALDELERTLRLADEVVRHKLIRLPDAEAERRGMTGTAA